MASGKLVRIFLVPWWTRPQSNGNIMYPMQTINMRSAFIRDKKLTCTYVDNSYHSKITVIWLTWNKIITKLMAEFLMNANPLTKWSPGEVAIIAKVKFPNTHPLLVKFLSISCWRKNHGITLLATQHWFRPRWRHQHFPRYWPFAVGIPRSHVSQWHGALTISLIGSWTNRWASNRDAGDFRRNCAHYDVTVMGLLSSDFKAGVLWISNPSQSQMVRTVFYSIMFHTSVSRSIHEDILPMLNSERDDTVYKTFNVKPLTSERIHITCSLLHGLTS